MSRSISAKRLRAELGACLPRIVLLGVPLHDLGRNERPLDDRSHRTCRSSAASRSSTVGSGPRLSAWSLSN